MKEKFIQLEKLSKIPSVPGMEQPMQKYIRKELEDVGYEIKRDNLGSVFGFKKSSTKNAKKVVIEAHMDDVSFMADNVKPNGLVTFYALGGIIKKWLIGNKMRLYLDLDQDKYIEGVVIAISPHQIKKISPDAFEQDGITIDFGFVSIDDAKKQGFKPGLAISWDPQFWVNNDSMFIKGADNKIGLGAVLEMSKKLIKEDLDFDLYIGATVQEELGLRGAKTSAQMIDPDLAFVIDTSPSNDVIPSGVSTPGSLREGVFLRHMDLGNVTKRTSIDFISKVAKDNDIKIQDYVSMGGTNAKEWSLQGQGTHILQMGILARNIHNSIGVASVDDYDNLIKLIYSSVKSLNEFDF